MSVAPAALPTTALAELLRSMADDEFVIGFSDSEWTGIAPLLEEDVAMSSLAQDELGHAAALYGLLATLTGDDPDALAYDREERYHRMHAETWLTRLARREGEPRDRLLAAFETLGPDAATVFTPLPDEPELVRAGILGAPMSDLEARWRASIAPLLAASRLPMPPPARDPMRGRLDHGDAFRWLWGEFTSVRRADPGATW